MRDVSHVGVAGAGAMGVGIAAVLASSGRTVTLFDPEPSVVESAPARLTAVLTDMDAGPAAIARVTLTSRLQDLSPADGVIEAAPERLELKRELYRAIFALIGPSAVVASNTSSLTPDRLAAELDEGAAARFLVAHFWNPPHLLPLVELVAAQRTTPAALKNLHDLLASAGLRPVLLARATPGFIGNRIQFAVMREALALVEAGIATPEQIDEVVRFSVGRRWAATGPFESADLGGLHVFLRVAEELMPDLAHGLEGVRTLGELVDQGREGVRTRAGFYDWCGERLEAATARRRRIATAASELKDIPEPHA